MDYKIINEIIENYYNTNNTPKNLISSHWEKYSNNFSIKYDSKGDIISLEGYGFGNITHNSIFHKILDNMCWVSHLLKLPHEKDLYQLIIKSLHICRAMKVDFSFDCFKQVCSLHSINKNLNRNMKQKHLTFLIIGDGYGFLSSLIKQIYPNSSIVLVDLGKTLLFQTFFCQTAHPNYQHVLINQNTKIIYENEDHNFIYCPTELLNKIGLKYDIIINIASMQEMNTTTINRYFDFIRKYSKADNLFYCCNRDKKDLIGGEKTEFKKYPWNKNDQILVNEICPWYSYILSLSRTKNGLRLFGIRIPFINYLDGVVWHRLSKMSKHL